MPSRVGIQAAQTAWHSTGVAAKGSTLLEGAPVLLRMKQSSANGPIGDTQENDRQDKGKPKVDREVYLILRICSLAPMITDWIRYVQFNIPHFGNLHIHVDDGRVDGSKNPAEKEDHIVIGSDPCVG